MTDFFSGLMNVGLSASVLIIAIIIFRLVFRRAPKRISCVLWGIAALRLIIPVRITTAFGALPDHKVINIGDSPAQNYISSGSYAVDDAVNDVIEAYSPDKLRFDAAELFPVLWVIGMVIMLVFAAASCIGIIAKTRASVRSDDGFYICDEISTPFILGIISPRIYIPSGIDKAFLGSVFAHEKAHIRRGDHIWKLLGYIILTVYWFNPAVWAAYILFCRDIEFACDEKVISGMTKEETADYSQALLSCGERRKIISFCPVAFGNVGVRKRITAILNYKKPSFWLIIAAVIVSILLILLFATSRNENREPDILETAESQIFTDESESHSGFYYCYNNPAFSGPVGIAKKSGEGEYTVLIKPKYDMIEITSQNRLIGRRSYNKQVYSALFDAAGDPVIAEIAGYISLMNDYPENPVFFISPSEEGGKGHFTDINGKKICDEGFSFVNLTCNELFFGKNESGYTFFYVNGKIAGKAAPGEKAVVDLRDNGHSTGLKLVIVGGAEEWDEMKYGVQSRSGETIVPCEYSTVTVIPGKRLVARKGSVQSLEPTDVAELYDYSGNKLTSGEYANIYYDEEDGSLIATIAYDNYTICNVLIDTDGKEISERSKIVAFDEEIPKITAGASSGG